MPYISYKNLLEELNIDRKKPLYISSDVFRMSFLAKRNGEEFSLELLLKSILNYMDLSEATILIPTYNLTAFTQEHFYDYKNTKGTVGVLGNAALDMSEFTRTWNPMHSFAVAGKDANYLAGLRNLNSFGTDGPFNYIMEQGAQQLMIDSDYLDGFTFVHFVETSVKVPYRYDKEFNGVYKYADGTEQNERVIYPCRYLNLKTEEQFNRIGAILEEKGVATHKKVNDLDFRVVDFAGSYPIIANDLNNNMAANCYDFNISREDIYNNNFVKEV